jgi:hypothetical protein
MPARAGEVARRAAVGNEVDVEGDILVWLDASRQGARWVVREVDVSERASEASSAKRVRRQWGTIPLLFRLLKALQSCTSV